MSDARSHPVLVHCASGNRVGPVMIAWLVLDRGWSWDRAVEAAKQGGMRSPELEAAARAYVEGRRD
jgi:protein-tyrosine phosphatase